MGRKKSVFLTVILTVVIVALCALTVFPAFTFKNSIKGWQPAISSLDAGTDLRSGYYTYYYPQGVISAKQYNDNLDGYKDDSEKKAEYEKSYVAYKGLYLSTDDKYGIFDDPDEVIDENGEVKVSDDFTRAFEDASGEVRSRFAQKGFTQYRVSVVDDYVLRVEVPAATKSNNVDDSDAMLALQAFSELGQLTVLKGTETIDELKKESLSSYIRSFSVKTEYGISYIVASLKSEGKELFGELKDNLSTYGSEEGTFLNFYIGDTTAGNELMKVGNDNFTDDMRIKYPIAEKENKVRAETYSIILNSALTSEFEIQFEQIASADIYKMKDSTAMTFVYLALALAILACLVLPVIFFGRYGVMSGYTTLSYMVVVGLCFAFITKAPFTITLGSVMIFLFGLLLINLINAYIYAAIKKETNEGKTIQSAVKKGYKKTLWHVIDLYAVLLLGSLATLIAVGGLQAFAWQALICFGTAAFCNLLWARTINFVLMSASKDKYRYFRLERKEDDDEE